MSWLGVRVVRAGYKRTHGDPAGPEQFAPEFESEASELLAAGFVARPPERKILEHLVGVRRRGAVEAPGWREASPAEIPARRAGSVEKESPGRKSQYRRSPEGGITLVLYDSTRTDPRLRGWGSMHLEAGVVNAVDAARDALGVLQGWGAERLTVHKPLAREVLAAAAPDLLLEPDVRMTVRWAFVP